MKKTILSLCVLGLGLSCVFGDDMGKGPDMAGGQDMRRGRMDGRPQMREHGKRFLNNAKEYIDAYQYFRAIANSQRPATKQTARAVEMAERIVKRQDKFVQKISHIAQKFRNIEIFREFGDKINSKLMENNAQMESMAKNDIMEANQGNKAPLWDHMRTNGENIRKFRQQIHHFVKESKHRKHAMRDRMKERASMVMEDDQGADDDETALVVFEEDSDSDDVDQA